MTEPNMNDSLRRLAAEWRTSGAEKQAADLELVLDAWTSPPARVVIWDKLDNGPMLDARVDNAARLFGSPTTVTSKFSFGLGFRELRRGPYPG